MNIHDEFYNLTTGTDAEQAEAAQEIARHKAQFTLFVVIPILAFWGLVIGGIYYLATK